VLSHCNPWIPISYISHPSCLSSARYHRLRSLNRPNLSHWTRKTSTMGLSNLPERLRVETRAKLSM
jgi:hypothetical protein